MAITHIYFDLDGTLLNSQKRISKDTYDYLVGWKRKYKLVYGIATGRNQMSVDKLLLLDDPFHIFEQFVFDNGVSVLDVKSNFSKRDGMIGVNEIRRIIEDYHGSEINVAFHNETQFCSSIYTERVRQIMTLNGSKTHLLLTKKSNFKATERVMLIVDESIQNKDSFIEYDGLRLIHPVTGIFEYLSESISKKTGLEKLMEKNNIKNDNILVFGDAENDIEMLQLTKNSVAMKNSTEEVKKLASYITKYNNDQNGISRFLQLYEDELNFKRSELWRK